MLRVAVPNKGGLAPAAVDMLREAGYRQRPDDKDLTCVDADNDVEFFYLRPRDIAVYVASGDLGSSASRKFDCEAWIPTQGKYRELTSTSDCTEFQSRRLSIRVRDGKQVKPLATLNGTLCAVPRTIVAILENHQQADGSVYVPPVLRWTAEIMPAVTVPDRA